MKLSLNFFNRMLQVRYFKIPALPISGYTSRTNDGFHVLFLDYDMVSPEIVAQDLKVLSEGISHAFVFTTHEDEDESGKYGNYHVICVDKFFYGDIHHMMSLTHSDSYHKDLAKQSRYRSWVLRMSNKGSRPEPRFVNFVSFQEPQQPQSRAHLKLLVKLYPELKKEIKKATWALDSSRKVIVTHYNTSVEKKA